jgi:hypothetical protein
VSGWRPGKEGLLKASRFLARGGVPRTPDTRTSENLLLGTSVNRGAVSQHGTIVASIGGCLTRAEAALTRTRFSFRPESPQGLAPLAGEVAREPTWRSVTSDAPRRSRRQ